MACFLVGLLLYMVSRFLQLLLGQPFLLWPTAARHFLTNNLLCLIITAVVDSASEKGLCDVAATAQLSAGRKKTQLYSEKWVPHMDIGWAEINSALDDLIAHEEGVRFQRLAISLAKQRWPETIATEIHRDAGEDALVHPYLTEGGKQFDILCSITDEYYKIKDDATKIFGHEDY